MREKKSDSDFCGGASEREKKQVGLIMWNREGKKKRKKKINLASSKVEEKLD